MNQGKLIHRTSEQDALLGKFALRKLPDQLVSNCVALRRTKRGIRLNPSPPQRRPWSDKEDKHLGTASLPIPIPPLQEIERIETQKLAMARKYTLESTLEG
jgi:hypothetical protein